MQLKYNKFRKGIDQSYLNNATVHRAIEVYEHCGMDFEDMIITLINSLCQQNQDLFDKIVRLVSITGVKPDEHL